MFREIDAFKLLVMILKMTVIEYEKTLNLKEKEQINRSRPRPQGHTSIVRLGRYQGKIYILYAPSMTMKTYSTYLSKDKYLLL